MPQWLIDLLKQAAENPGFQAFLKDVILTAFRDLLDRLFANPEAAVKIVTAFAKKP